MKKIILMLTVVVLAGCSTKFVYRNADWLTYWYLDDYISLDSEQEARFDERLLDWLQWHKSQELGKYVAQLNDLKSDIQTGNITEQSIEAHQNRMLSHWHRIRDKLTPDLAQMANMLSQEQVDELFDELAESQSKNAKKREKRTEEQRKKRWVEGNKDNLDQWLGKLTDEQEQLVEDLYGKKQHTADLWHQYRTEYHQQLKAVFEQPDRGENFTHTLLALLNNPEQFRSEQLNARNEHNQALDRMFLVKIYKSLTDKQRKHLLRELDDLAEDLSSLQK
ncbi:MULTISPECIES: DUF6279 family lipoprotein [Pseudoalteromonas]|uniref:Lipoprotein n=1 Tax=Pseudoalteromonas amylolytica TaxID=1859457 RepID=A0A1S1MRT7_9GAMM|nr:MULTISPECIES: DUF6279 family lipoprotein [Pseudoalteromonas]OHU86685.1 hypothetical protein BFC16_14360 [Pseudoalteromonas sp. JW3]OHU88791.1 hypothetical protein BET10_18395 [Pseudoalteromonas amylolytica]